MLLFEWDEEKAAANWKKHRVNFEDAMRVFEDDNRIEFIVTTKTDTIAIGMVRDILFVVYTERKEYIRIISARKANPKEQRLYYNRRERRM